MSIFVVYVMCKLSVNTIDKSFQNEPCLCIFNLFCYVFYFILYWNFKLLKLHFVLFLFIGMLRDFAPVVLTRFVWWMLRCLMVPNPCCHLTSSSSLCHRQSVSLTLTWHLLSSFVCLWQFLVRQSPPFCIWRSEIVVQVERNHKLISNIDDFLNTFGIPHNKRW